MIHILLTTLKVIGILLAIVLGLILTLVLVVLFVPIRYKADVKNIDVDARVTWLFHLVSVKLWYKDKEFKYIIKVLGIDINKFKKKEKKTDTNNKNVEEKKPVKEANVIKDDSVNNNKRQENKALTTDKKPEEQQKKSLKEKISDIINNLKFKIKNIYDKIISIKDKITAYKDFLTTDEAKLNINEILRLVFGLLAYILPTKLKGKIKFGFEDPETTGKALGAICMFYGLYGEKVELYPNFEEKVFDADITFKGRIRLYRILIVVYKLWKNEWIKKFMKFAKTH